MEGKLDVSIQNSDSVLQNGDDDSTVEIALFGLGRIGTIHLENLLSNPQIKVHYCVEQCPERSNFVKNRWRLYDTEFVEPSEDQQVLDDPRVDAVVVCTPTGTHESLVLRSLHAGKAVLCEKPLAFSYEGIQKCYEAARDANKPLLCAFNRRFDPGFRSIKQRVLEGEVGKVHVVKTCSRDSPLPSIEYLKTSGGMFHDSTVHDIDLICWIMGEYPISVSAQAHAFIPAVEEIGDYDTIAVVLKFPSGSLGVIDMSRNSVYGYDQRLEVFGPKGMLTCGDVRPTSVQRHSTIGSTAVPICFSFASRYHESYLSEINHFVSSVLGHAKIEISGEDTLANSRIASACDESAKTNRVVQINWDKK